MRFQAEQGINGADIRRARERCARLRATGMPPPEHGRPAPRCFAVVREAGPSWENSRSLTDQTGWTEHAEFMNGLVDDGLVVLGGTLGNERRALLVVLADTPTPSAPG